MRYNLNFHETFSPEKYAIAQLLQLSMENMKFLTKEEISRLTTIPTGKYSGKVVPNLIYANIMNVINVEYNEGKFKISPTPLGKVVYREDPYLVEELTMWVCHYNLTTQTSKSVLWSYIFNEVIPQVGTVFSKEALSGIVTKKFGVDVNLSPFRSCYLTNERSFASLGILEEDSEFYKFNSHKINPSLKYLYAYQLLSSWELHLVDRTEITIDDIKDILNFGAPYIWGEKEILNVLELLQDAKLVSLNRQLNPITIIRREVAEAMLVKIYSLLI